MTARSPEDARSEGVSDSPQRVRDRAQLLGFDVVGFARADLPLEADFARYEAFVDAGMQGEMDWLADNRGVRRALDGESILKGAKSVVCVARRYQRSAEEEARDPVLARTIARYARGHDYHNGLRKKLRQLAAFLRTMGTPEVPVQARPLCDDAPVLERAWAARAGLGFVGKNGLLIVPGQGSFVLLGEVVTTLALPPGTPIAERCGSCTRCLDACPTRAFPRPFVLDPRRCIAYLTIESHGSLAPADRDAIGDRLFGCDDCQSVCPFNASTRPRDEAAVATFAPLEAWVSNDLASLLALDEARFGEVLRGSPVKRATKDGLARNAAVVLGNRRDPGARAALSVAAAHHPSAVVRETAAWALGKIDEPA
jgi:epoxyqueuosine reductase